MAAATKKKPKAQKSKASPAKRPVKNPTAADPADRSAPSLAEVDGEVLEFIEAIDRFKKQNGRPFPSWSEVLLVLRELGYRRG